MNVLVIEDDRKIASLLERGLSEHGHQVSVSGNGREAAEMIMGGGYDAALLDILLPGIDGLTVLEQVRTKRCKTAIMMLTAVDTLPKILEAFDLGADDYLVKPFLLEILLARLTTAYQAGTVLKLKRIMFDGDVYRIKFQNAYSSFTPANGAPIYFLNPDSITIGGELETNVSLTRGLSLYANGSVGRAQYTGAGVPSGLWVANTPSYTQGLGLTYQQRNFDLGIFQKRIGPMWSDNKSYHNQVAIDPFTMVNLFLNYTIRNNTRFDQTKIGLSFNNLLNSENTIGVTPANAAVPVSIGGVNSTYLANTTPAGGDLLTLTPGRSVMLSVTFGLQRNR